MRVQTMSTSHRWRKASRPTNPVMAKEPDRFAIPCR
jgi:hypothetical protein